MQSTNLTLRIVRTFSATPDQLFRAWTDESLLFQWGAPEGCEMVSYTADARVGGRWECTFAVGLSERHTESGEYVELVPGKRIVQTLLFPLEEGPPEGITTVITVEFRELRPGLTEMTFVQTGAFSPAVREGMVAGWSSNFDKLEALIA